MTTQNLSKLSDQFFDDLVQDSLEIGSIQIPSELKDFGKFIRENVENRSNVVEIGTKYGGTTYFLAKTLIDCSIISIDAPRATEWKETPRYRNRWFKVLFQDRVQWIVGDSHQQSTKTDLIAKLYGFKIDLLFIDGDHSYNGVKQDFEMYSHLVKKGGFIVFHDIKDTEHHRNLNPPCMVGPFWDEIKNKYESYEFRDDSENWGGIGVIKWPG